VGGKNIGQKIILTKIMVKKCSMRSVTESPGAQIGTGVSSGFAVTSKITAFTTPIPKYAISKNKRILFFLIFIGKFKKLIDI
jgi:hypothetical protein